MAKQIRYDHFLHGGDYNPEQWLDRPDILKKDIEYFKKAHINTVSMGMFSWAVLEPEEGKYNFDWLEAVINNLYKEGIYTILSTPSGARPKWMADKYEEVLRMDPDRTRRFFGGRHNHCYTSPVYREKIFNINKKLSERFGKHPAVILWHISNEYGGECHCPLCQEKFREWLKEKYGTIENLNSRWCTTFWSHTYNSFDQIESPSPKGENALHALTLDWKRFVTDRTVDFMKHEISAIRAGGSDLPATANLMYDYDGLDYKKFKDVMDIASWDNYPSWHKKDNYTTAVDGALQHDLMRSIKKAPFLLMESCPSATNWKPINKLKKPGMHLAASLQAVAHGSDSVLYFQLRQSQGASEKFHGAVIDHYGGDDTRVFREVTEVGKVLEQIQETVGSVTKSPVAVLYDRENDWALKDAVEKDCCHRAASVKEEIAFALQHEDLAGIFGKLLENGEVPLRVTHNDTKLNNIMIDLETGKGICVVDLDTVMPGLAMNDFGDAIRFGASTALEDEKDLSKVSCDMELYEIYVKGFLESCGDKLNAREIEMLPMGAKVMTYECGIRFLTDYLEGDHYFKIDREDHNLDRCRTQFKLVADMEQKWEQMQAIVKKYQK